MSEPTTTGDGAIPGSAAGRAWLSARGWLFRGGPLVALIVLVVALAIASPHFFTPGNLLNITRQTAITAILAIGQTFVILTAGIDLSVGSIVAVVAVTSALLLDAGLPIVLVLAAGLAIGAALGAINGLGITVGRLPPFIMTLGMMVMGRGFAMTISDGHPIHFRERAADFGWLGQGTLLGLPVPVWLFAVVAAAAYVVLRYTAFGRNVYATGSNPEAARLAGINVRLVVFSVYVISGALSAVCTALAVVLARTMRREETR